MPVVTNTVLLPDGSGAQYATVVIRLVANATVGTEAPGYVGTSEILGTFVPAVSSEGVWSLTLTANSLITPSGTVYQITTQIPGRPVVVEYVSVPNGAGPYSVANILTSAPSSITPTELAAHLADTVDAHDASAVSVLDSAGKFTATTVEGVLAELRTFDAVVDAAGTGTHTTLHSALAAVASGASILVRSDLTVTDALGPVIFTQPVTVVWRSGPGQAVKVFNDQAVGADLFKSNVAIGSLGAVNGVHLVNPRVTRSVAGKGGRAFNMHGAFHWRVEYCQVENHQVGVYLDASPPPGGQGSHNVFEHLFITSCETGVHNTGSANINEFVSLHTQNCSTVHFWHETGLNPTVHGYRVENLAAALATELIRVDGQGLKIFGLHAESGVSVGALKLNSGSSGTHIVGNIYNTTGTATSISDGAASYFLALTGQPVLVRGSNSAMTLTRKASGIGPVVEVYGRDADAGPDIQRFEVRGDGLIRVPGITTAPSYQVAEGDEYTKTASGGAERYLYTNGAWRRLLTMNSLVATQGHRLGTRAETMSRMIAGTTTTENSSILSLWFFTPLEDLTVTTFQVVTGVAAATITTSRLGLYTIASNGDGTLVAATANDTGAYPGASTLYSRVFDAGGGLPTSYALVRGVRYAVGSIQVATTPATFRGVGPGAALTSLVPSLAYQITSQSNLPTSFLNSAQTTRTTMAWVGLIG